MSVILLLLLFIIWMAWSPDDAGRALVSQGAGSSIFLAGYLLVVIGVAWWSRRLARRVISNRLSDPMRRFNFVVSSSQIFIPAWLAVGVFGLGWGFVVQRMLGRAADWPVELPGLVLGILPSLLAWMGLWWAQYPVDRALREQNLLTRLDSDMPVYAPPTFREHFFGKLRMQLLFTVVPILMIVTARDAAGWPLHATGWIKSQGVLDLIVSGGAATVVFLIAPEVLRRVLSTESLPDPVLRGRLDAVSRQAGVGCRDVLLWRTHHTVGNAAVMGLVPRLRYVILSDVLLESLRDDEIAAVFAHEVGHIIHRHMLWYAMFFVSLSLGLVGLKSAIDACAARAGIAVTIVDEIYPFIGIAAFVICFGYLSRRFERQADVYAARTMEAMSAREPSPAERESRAVPARSGAARPGSSPARGTVGVTGAELFNSALLRVSDINNIPLGSRGRFGRSLRDRLGFAIEWFGTMAGSWLHGTMASRMLYISQISKDPRLTQRFDQRMLRVRLGLVAMLLVCGAWAAIAIYNDKSTDKTELVVTMHTAVLQAKR